MAWYYFQHRKKPISASTNTNRYFFVAIDYLLSVPATETNWKYTAMSVTEKLSN